MALRICERRHLTISRPLCPPLLHTRCSIHLARSVYINFSSRSSNKAAYGLPCIYRTNAAYIYVGAHPSWILDDDAKSVDQSISFGVLSDCLPPPHPTPPSSFNLLPPPFQPPPGSASRLLQVGRCPLKPFCYIINKIQNILIF